MRTCRGEGVRSEGPANYRHMSRQWHEMAERQLYRCLPASALAAKVFIPPMHLIKTATVHCFFGSSQRSHTTSFHTPSCSLFFRHAVPLRPFVQC